MTTEATVTAETAGTVEVTNPTTELKDKLEEKALEAVVERPTYMNDNGDVITLDEAKKLRWAHKETGEITKIYQLRLEKRQAIAAGLPVPVRFKTPAPKQSHNGIESPYDLRRRSGYATIWQVLAENVNNPVDAAFLQTEVNLRLRANYPEYMEKNYPTSEYDTFSNSIVMNRAPFNAEIEALQQRVTVDTEKKTVTLNTNVTTPRELKKRGRKLGSKNKIGTPADPETPVVSSVPPILATSAGMVEADTDNHAEVVAEVTTVS